MGFASYQMTFRWQTNVVFLERLAQEFPSGDKRPKIVDRRDNILMRLAAVYGGKRDFARAAEVLRTVIEERPDFAPAHNQLGETLRQAGNPLAAEASFSEALRIDPDYCSAMNGLGVAYAQQGRLDDAMQQFLKVLDRHPEQQKQELVQLSALENIAQAFRLQGKATEAEVYRQRAQQVRSTLLTH